MNPLDSVRAQLRRLRGGEVEVYERVELRAWTTLRVGGVADLMIRCKSAEGVQQALDLLSAHGIQWFVLGAGSRLVAPDEGLRVPVVSLGGELATWEVDDHGAVTGAGASMAQVCQAVMRSGLSGVLSLAAANGTVGGAVATALEAEPEQALEWIEVARPGRERVRLPVGRKGIRGPLDPRQVVVRARLDGRAPPDELLVRRPDSGMWRAPGYLEPVFRDPPRQSAQQLLAEAGCGGLTSGGARVCERNPNRILTSRRTSASDVTRVFVLMRARVQECCDVVLEAAALFLDPLGREATP